MSWIKEANKIGRYINTYKGFRLYCTLEPTYKESIVERDGEKWHRTDFTAGHYVAIDKTGMQFSGTEQVAIAIKIDWELMRRYYAKKYGEE